MQAPALRLALAMPLALVTLGGAAAGPIGFALGADGASLLRFDLAHPGAIKSLALSGAGTRLDAIDFRPRTGELFGYDDASDRYFTVDVNTGMLKGASSSATATNSRSLGLDWNPTIDRLRVVTDTNQNIVYNPDTATASNAATVPLFYGPGDVNEGRDPGVVANGYTNSFAGATTTQQYVLDAQLNTLATLANNAGRLATVATITVMGVEFDFDPSAGFDILPLLGGGNMAYALLTEAGAPGATAGIYTIDLTSGAATFLGALDSAIGQATGLAVTVPEPATIGLLLAGGLLLLARAPSRKAGQGST